MKIDLWQGDCLELMKQIPDGSIDMVLTDPPYGFFKKTGWDNIIPFAEMWDEINRIIKSDGAICLFGNEPYTSALIQSNVKGFKYRWCWDKKIPSGMSYAKYRPMQQFEDVSVFSFNGNKTVYYPQRIKRDKPIKSGGQKISQSAPGSRSNNFKKTYDYKNPTTIIQFDKIRKGSVHPTQKPTKLLEYLISTYTLEGETVLDFTMGSGSTGVAAKNLNRNFIGIELDKDYFEIAKERING